MFFFSVLPFSNSLPSVQIQLVERIPGIRCLSVFADMQITQPRPDTLCLSVPVAMGMYGKNEENILTNPRRQVDQLRARQRKLRRKIFHAYRVDESFKAAHTFKRNFDSESPGYE